MNNDTVELMHLLRTDALTGVGNMISFYECLYDRIENKPDTPFALISADINGLKTVNDDYGHSAGDTAIRWFALLLKEETDGQVFRLGGDEFALILSDRSPEYISETVMNLYRRLNKEAHQVYLQPPVASIAVIHYEGLTEFSLSRIMGIFYHVIEKKKDNRSEAYEVYQAEKIPKLPGLNTSTMDMIRKLARIGEMLDDSFRMAYTDKISGLPNMNAAQQHLEAIHKEVSTNNSSFSILLIDGDNLSQYNDISYILGDWMIKELGGALKGEMRPDDFLARWRSGDEFVVVLPGASCDQAQRIGDRLREKVKTVSQGWQFPITISIGVACYPDNGSTIDELIDCAEKALRKAKAQGKDCIASMS